MGTLAADGPLEAAVARAAVAAGTGDPRFAPVEDDEIDLMEIEISVLSAMSELGSADHLEIGRHGLHVSREAHRGLLLPQVASEHGWDREQFLAQACLKADLPREAWRDPTTLVKTFTALVFRDPDTSAADAARPKSGPA